MSSSDKEKAGEKSAKRKQKRSRKAEQAQSPIPDQQQAARELIDAAIAAADASPAAAVVAPAEPAETSPVAEPVSVEPPPRGAPEAETTAPVGLQTIASAYRDYTRKSLEDARSYVEKLSGVRSFGKAMEVQTEFAKQAYETFAADSRRIRDLYGEYFKQTLRLPMSPFERPRDR